MHSETGERSAYLVGLVLVKDTRKLAEESREMCHEGLDQREGLPAAKVTPELE
jgi:hypothetical protein